MSGVGGSVLRWITPVHPFLTPLPAAQEALSLSGSASESAVSTAATMTRGYPLGSAARRGLSRSGDAHQLQLQQLRCDLVRGCRSAPKQ